MEPEPTSGGTTSRAFRAAGLSPRRNGARADQRRDEGPGPLVEGAVAAGAAAMEPEPTSGGTTRHPVPGEGDPQVDTPQWSPPPSSGAASRSQAGARGTAAAMEPAAAAGRRTTRCARGMSARRRNGARPTAAGRPRNLTAPSIRRAAMEPARPAAGRPGRPARARGGKGRNGARPTSGGTTDFCPAIGQAITPPQWSPPDSGGTTWHTATQPPARSAAMEPAGSGGKTGHEAPL